MVAREVLEPPTPDLCMLEKRGKCKGKALEVLDTYRLIQD